VRNTLSHTRQLVAACLDLPAVLDRIGDDDDLVASGVDSGEILNLATLCEQILDRPLSDDELTELTSIRAVGALLRTA
jgi:hypothetical protein